MNKKSTKNLITLLALTFLIGGANMASAYVPGVWEPQPHINAYEPAFTKIPMPYDEPVVPQSTSTVVATNTQPKKVATTTTTKKTTVASTKTSTNTASNGNLDDGNLARELKPEMKAINPSDDNNGLTALSFRGSGGFMPSSIWQWFIVILLILAIIIIARMIGRSRTHEVHTVTH